MKYKIHNRIIIDEICIMGTKKTQEYDDAYDLFVNNNLTKKEICKIVNVSAQQLGKWAKDNDWELDKTANETTVPKLILGFYRNIALINKKAADEKRPLDTSDTDRIVKLTNSIQTLKRKLNLSNYHAVLSEFLEWENKEHNENAKILATDMLEFLKEKAKLLRDDN